MMFKDSEACRVSRWSELFEPIIGDWEVLWVDLDDAWAGSCAVLVEKGGQYIFADWTWGSCEACDSFDELSADGKAEEAERCVMRFKDRAHLDAWIEMMIETYTVRGDELKAAVVGAP